MELLKQRILQDGRCYPGGILKVDSFINHQMDPMLMYKIAEEFIRRFQDRKINKIVTIEASGIAPAIMVGYIMQLPVVFVKKKKPKTMENMLSTVVHSFTKDRDYTVCISNNFLTPEDHILFIDDFLAYGNAAMGMVELAEQSGAVIEGMGFIIEKAFQDGGNLLREKGIRVESLAIIDNLDDCKITVRYVNFLGIDFTVIEEGRVEAHMPLHDEQRQYSGVTHGGVLAALADTIAGFAAYTMTPLEKDVLTAELKMSFLRAAWGNELIAKGTVIKAGRNIHFCECEIYCDDKLVSKSSGTFCVVHPQV